MLDFYTELFEEKLETNSKNLKFCLKNISIPWLSESQKKL